MDASPLAQLNNRQQQSALRPIEDGSSFWDTSKQHQQIRPNPLQRGPFSRNYNSMFGSFSTTSSSNYTNATSAGAENFGLKNRFDFLSPMASLTADMSANLSLD